MDGWKSAPARNELLASLSVILGVLRVSVVTSCSPKASPPNSRSSPTDYGRSTRSAARAASAVGPSGASSRTRA